MAADLKFLFEPLAIPGAFRVTGRPHRDERGSFERIWCQDEFQAAGIPAPFVQANVSFNTGKAVVRGLHFLAAPLQEGKFIRSLQGSLFDVFVDLRKGSPTFGHWHGEELTPQNAVGIFMPPGCAHGYMTLSETSAAHYQVQAAYDPSSDRTVKWDDPEIGIDWPNAGPVEISSKDAAAANLADIDVADLLVFEGP